MEPKLSIGPPQIEPVWGPDGVGEGKKSEKEANAAKKRVAPHSVARFFRKKWPRGPQLGSQNGAKMVQKSMQKSIKVLMVFGIDFWRDFGGFWEPKWSQVGVKMGWKIDIADVAEKPTKR